MSVKLYHGDCLEIMPQIESGSIDMVLCDLPYGTTACSWDTVIPFGALWLEYNRVVKENGAVVLFGAEPFSSYLRMSNIKNYKYDLYWYKNKPSGALTASHQPMRAVETISVFYRKPPKYNPKMIKRTEQELKRLSKKSVITGGSEIDGRKWAKTANRFDSLYKYPTNVLKFKTVFNRGKEKYAHPSQKPVPLLRYLVEMYTDRGDTVLDNTMGSGSTGVACCETGRNFVGIEQRDDYFNICRLRMYKHLKEEE